MKKDMRVLIQSECMKLKRSWLLWITTLLPVFAVLEGVAYVRAASNHEASQVWNSLYVGSAAPYVFLIHPILITLIYTMTARMEHQQDNWKLLLSRPVNRGHLYLSKLLVGLLLILYSMLVLMIAMLAAGLLEGADASQLPWTWIFLRPLMSIVASLPMIGLIFLVSTEFSHAGWPLALGVGLSLPAILISNSASWWIFYPWCYPIVVMLAETGDTANQLNGLMWICLISFAAISAAGYIRFRNKEVLS
ncbi:ABC transporter permease [Marinicrinis sediminis]|uniref:ABC transporter permease n=1 Tax=Marinicrinis sediminis TaxID=1652465 RepID=A0ABW5R7V0_9BACL